MSCRVVHGVVWPTLLSLACAVPWSRHGRCPNATRLDVCLSLIKAIELLQPSSLVKLRQVCTSALSIAESTNTAGRWANAGFQACRSTKNSNRTNLTPLQGCLCLSPTVWGCFHATSSFLSSAKSVNAQPLPASTPRCFVQRIAQASPSRKQGPLSNVACVGAVSHRAHEEQRRPEPAQLCHAAGASASCCLGGDKAAAHTKMLCLVEVQQIQAAAGCT